MAIIGRKNWQRTVVQPWQRYIVGLDLGQAHDFTALTIVQHSIEPTGDVEIQHGRLGGPGRLIEKAKLRFDVRHLERLPLGMPYPEVADYVRELLIRPPLHDEAELVADGTGVGRAVLDIFEERGMSPVRVTITSGNEETYQGGDRWHVPKSTLISAVDAKLHCGELRFAEDLAFADALREELREFHRRTSATGRNIYGAREGKHDDLLLSVSIALWRAMQKSEGPVTAPIDGFY